MDLLTFLTNCSGFYFEQTTRIGPKMNELSDNDNTRERHVVYANDTIVVGATTLLQENILYSPILYVEISL